MKTLNRPTRRSAAAPARASGEALKTILAPIDFSDLSITALERVNEMARAYGSSVCMVYVIEPPAFVSDLSNIPIALTEEELVTSARNKLIKLAQSKIDPTINSYPSVRIGKPHREIAALAREVKADLIVLPSHGYTGVKHALLGSVAEKVVQLAPCSVLVLKGDTNFLTPLTK